jgi:hypothetical protein
MSLFGNIVKKVLIEYANEPRLPFEKGEKFGKKNTEEQFVDWLEDFGKYGKLPASKISFSQGVESGLPIALNWMLKKYTIDPYNEDDADYGFDLNSDENDDEVYEKKAYYLSQLYGYLRKNGFYSKNGAYGPEFNERNLMYVERAIRLPSNLNSENNQLLYKELIKNYQNNVGGCWTWEEGRAAAYCSQVDGSLVEFKGYIRLEDIDWVETDYCNMYNMNGEREIRVKPNAKVEVFEIDTDFTVDSHKAKVDDTEEGGIHFHKIPLRGTLIVNATYFGNGGKYNGDYAQVYDATSREQKYMDRKGNIVGENVINQQYYNIAKEFVKNNSLPIGGQAVYKDLLFEYCSNNLYKFAWDEDKINFIRLTDSKILLPKPCKGVTKEYCDYLEIKQGLNNVRYETFYVCGYGGQINSIIASNGDLITNNAYIIYPSYGIFLPYVDKGITSYGLINAETHKVQMVNHFELIKIKEEDEIALIDIKGKGANILLANGKLIFNNEWPVKAPVINRYEIEFVFKDGTRKTFDTTNFKIVD